MNLFETLQSLKELAYERGYVINKLRELSDNRYEHLLKLYFYRNIRSDEFNGWCKEVTNYSRLYKSNTKIKLRDLNKILWDEPKDDYTKKDIKIILDNFHFDGYPKIENFNYDNVFNYLKEFNEWLAKMLSNERVKIFDVTNKISELLNKYSIE